MSVPIGSRAAPTPSLLAGHRTFLLAMTLAAVTLFTAAFVKGLLLTDSGPSTPTGPSPFAYPEVRPAPAIGLIDQDEQAFDLASLRGQAVLVFFGYTHCPDVCPATIGQLNHVLELSPTRPRILFVTIDPERDTPAFLREYLKYMPAGYTPLTGTATQVRTVADAWGVRYARVETGSANGYAMAHTADVYLVDAQGNLRAHYPFGTQAPAIVADLERLDAEARS